MAAIIQGVVRAFSPSDTHCAVGENCQSAKYCPKNSEYVNGKCEANKGVAAGDSCSSSSSENSNDRENKRWVQSSGGTTSQVRNANYIPGLDYYADQERNYTYYNSRMEVVGSDGYSANGLV